MNIDQFMLLPMMSVGLASTTFTGQNVGAGQIDRAKKGARTAFLLSELVTIVMMIPLLIFTPQMVYLFNQETEVIRYGTLFLYLLSGVQATPKAPCLSCLAALLSSGRFTCLWYPISSTPSSPSPLATLPDGLYAVF